MTPQVIRIATRHSPLAMWQANYVKTELLKYHPDLTVEILAMKTQGDKILDYVRPPPGCGWMKTCL